MFNEFPSFVAEDSRRFISQDTGNLYISKVQPSDVGSYICLVKNTVTNARVLSPPTPLTLKTDGEALRLKAPLTHYRPWFVWMPQADKSQGFYWINQTKRIAETFLCSFKSVKCFDLYLFIFFRSIIQPPQNLFSTDKNLRAFFTFCWRVLLYYSAFREEVLRSDRLIKVGLSCSFHWALMLVESVMSSIRTVNK